jgi:hypothetical protein
MSESASRARVLDLLAEAATHELEFIRCGRLLAGAEGHWGIDRDLYSGSIHSAEDRQEQSGAEESFINACFVFAELLELVGPQFEQAFDLAATHYELAAREQRELDPAGVDEIRTLTTSFRTLPTSLLAAAESATRCADTAATLMVTTALYPPNRNLEAALSRVEVLERQIIGSYRSVRDRYRRLVETLDSM